MYWYKAPHLGFAVLHKQVPCKCSAADQDPELREGAVPAGQAGNKAHHKLKGVWPPSSEPLKTSFKIGRSSHGVSCELKGCEDQHHPGLPAFHQRSCGRAGSKTRHCHRCGSTIPRCATVWWGPDEPWRKVCPRTRRAQVQESCMA